MGSPDRMASLIERIDALNRRIEAQLDDPVHNIETLARLVAMHEGWRKTMADCLASMERASELLERSRNQLGSENTGAPHAIDRQSPSEPSTRSPLIGRPRKKAS